LKQFAKIFQVQNQKSRGEQRYVIANILERTLGVKANTGLLS